MGEEPRPVALVRGLSLLDATLLIVGSVVGSGIFFAPSIMAGYLQSPGLLLGLWVTGGLLTLAGAPPARPGAPPPRVGLPARAPSLRRGGLSFFLVCMPVADPRSTGFGLLLTAAGVPAYLCWRRHR